MRGTARTECGGLGGVVRAVKRKGVGMWVSGRGRGRGRGGTLVEEECRQSGEGGWNG